MRTKEENRIYMRNYMRKKYQENNKELCIVRNNNYKINKYSIPVVIKRIDENINIMFEDITNMIMMNSNDITDEVIDDITINLSSIIDLITDGKYKELICSDDK
jgi:hypothetical protein